MPSPHSLPFLQFLAYAPHWPNPTGNWQAREPIDKMHTGQPSKADSRLESREKGVNRSSKKKAPGHSNVGKDILEHEKEAFLLWMGR